MPTTRPRRRSGWIGPSFRATAPWLLCLVTGRVVVTELWSPLEQASWVPTWLPHVVQDIALALPFLLFPVGLALGKVLGHSRRPARLALLAGLSVSIMSYSLDAWVVPKIEHGMLAARGADVADARRFGSRTPIGILRNIDYVQTNPPSEYSLQTTAPEEFPPNVLLWHLHRPLALAVFGIANVLLGMLASELTVDLPRRIRRNARLAIGVGGAIVFMACVVLASPVEPFLRDGTMRSGIAGAWAPLLVTLFEGLIFWRLVKSRRHG